MASLGVILGELTQAMPVTGGIAAGGLHAAMRSTKTAIRETAHPATRPTRKPPCCKTCGGKACIGRCKF